MPTPVPAHLARFISRASHPSTYAVASRHRFPMISIGDARFTAVDAEGEETLLGLKEFEFIVISSNPHMSKTYYTKGYDPKNPGAPDCYSDNGLFPDVRVANPQHDNCTNCPMNMWGSAKSNITSKDIKACSDTKKMAVLPFDDKGNELGLHMFRISPAALPNWGAYVQELSKTRITDEFGLTPEFVVTRALWSDKKNVMKFQLVDFLNEDESEYTRGLCEAGAFETWIGTDHQSQTRPQLAASPRHVHQQLADHRQEKVIDVEPEEPKSSGIRRGRPQEAQPEPEVEQPRRRRVGGASEFLDEEPKPGRARAEMLEGGKSQGQRVSAVDAARARARDQIANGQGRK